jgi:methylaspartate mutase epsilon subunit
MLSAGPSAERVEQLVALMEEGIVEIVGPSAQFTALDEPDGRFGVFSPQVEGSMRLATVLIEARMPNPNLPRNISPLLHQMLTDGLIAEHVSVDPTGGDRFETGGIAVTPAPYHVLDARGRANANIYCLGVPTEHTRWFTNVGSGTPDVTTAFVRDADAIAADVLRIPALSEHVQEEVA